MVDIVTPRPAQIGLYDQLTPNDGDHDRVHQLQHGAKDFYSNSGILSVILKSPSAPLRKNAPHSEQTAKIESRMS